ncbi:MAG: TRAP transporter small permease subunit [Burkholderiales bacterium]
MRLFAKIDDTLEIIEQAVVIFLFAALVLMITANIIARNLFGVSYQKILEISPNIVLWLALIGATLALKKQRHIKLEILLRYAGHRTRRLARLLGSLFGAVVMGFLFAASLTFVRNEMAIFGLQGGSAVVFPLFFAMSFFRSLLGGLAAVRPATALASGGPGHDRGTTRDDPPEGGA